MRLVLILFFSALTLFAEAITFPQALEMLKHQNLELKMADYDIESAKQSEDMASAQHYGSLNFIQNVSRTNDAGNAFGFKLTAREANFGDFGAEEFMGKLLTTGVADYDTPPSSLNHPGNLNFWQSKLTYELPLYTGNKITAYEEMAKEMRHISVLDKQQQYQEKVYELRKSYFNMGLLKHSLKNLHLILNNMVKLETTTQNMIDEGYAKRVDILEVRSKQANVRRIITELEANQELLYHYLSFLLNQDVTEIAPPHHQLAAPNITVEEILNNSIDIKKANTALRIHGNMLTVEESKYLPTVGAMAEGQTADENFLGDASDHKSYTIGVRLTWNIFSGGGDSAAIEQAQINRLKSQTQADLAKKGIALRVNEIKTKIKQAESQIKNLQMELSLDQEIYKNYEGRYKEQLISMNDVIIKQSIWLENILALLQANNTRNQQIFALEKLALLGDSHE